MVTDDKFGNHYKCQRQHLPLVNLNPVFHSSLGMIGQIQYGNPLRTANTDK